jgi:hypothetical protein
LNPRFSVLALLPQMTRRIQEQQPTLKRQRSSYRFLPAQISKQNVECETQLATLECKWHLGEEKANLNSRISEIGLCSGKHATKQFSNRNKNAFFVLLKHLETSEKRS